MDSSFFCVFFILKQVKWYKSLNENDKAVQKYAFSKEDYLAYSETRRAGNPDFDLLAKKSQK